MTLATAINEDYATFFSKFILDRFPSDVGGLSDSLGYQVLSRLSHSLSRLPYSSTQLQERLDGHRREIEKAPVVLEDPSKFLQGGWFDDAEADGKTNKRSTTRPTTSRFEVATGMDAEVNDQLFQALGHQAPKSHDPAQHLLQSTMDTQKTILKVRPPPSAV